MGGMGGSERDLLSSEKTCMRRRARRKRPPVSGAVRRRGSEERGRTVEDHGLVLLLSGALVVVAPVDVVALAAMQVEQLLEEDGGRLGARVVVHALHGEEVPVASEMKQGKEETKEEACM